MESPPKRSFFSGIKEFFSGDSKAKKPMLESMPPAEEKEKAVEKKKKKKVKKAVKPKVEKKMEAEGYEDNSSDDEKGGKPRSMASLVLSDIEDGIDRHFD